MRSLMAVCLSHKQNSTILKDFYIVSAHFTCQHIRRNAVISGMFDNVKIWD